MLVGIVAVVRRSSQKMHTRASDLSSRRDTSDDGGSSGIQSEVSFGIVSMAMSYDNYGMVCPENDKMRDMSSERFDRHPGESEAYSFVGECYYCNIFHACAASRHSSCLTILRWTTRATRKRCRSRCLDIRVKSHPTNVGSHTKLQAGVLLRLR